MDLTPADFNKSDYISNFMKIRCSHLAWNVKNTIREVINWTNMSKRKEVSDFDIGITTGCHITGISSCNWVRIIAESNFGYVVKKWAITGSMTRTENFDRPRKLTERDKCILIIEAHEKQKKPFQIINSEFDQAKGMRLYGAPYCIAERTRYPQYLQMRYRT